MVKCGTSTENWLASPGSSRKFADYRGGRRGIGPFLLLEARNATNAFEEKTVPLDARDRLTLSLTVRET